MLMRFLAVSLGTVALLAALNLLPTCLGGEPRGVIRYPSLEAVEARYRVRLWAPAGRLAGEVRLSVGEPGWLAFALNGLAGGTLAPPVVCQTLAPATADVTPDVQVPETLVPGGELLQAREWTAADRRAQLRRVLLADGTLVHELWWREGGRHVMLRIHGDADRLVRLFNEIVRQVP
jgi:hypothetical protein